MRATDGLSQIVKTEPIEEFRPDDITGDALESAVRVKEEPRDDDGDNTVIDVEKEYTTDDCVEVAAAYAKRRRRIKRVIESAIDERTVNLRQHLRETECRLRDALAEIGRLQRIQSELEQENATLIRARQVRWYGRYPINLTSS